VAVIGKPHNDSIPAMKLLEKEGFHYKSTVDIFDAGPVVECEFSQVQSIREATAVTVKEVINNTSKSYDEPNYMISNRCIENYRAILSYTSLENNEGITLSSNDAKRLQAEKGSTVNLLPLRV
jgi:arginine N-succinyltransferase